MDLKINVATLQTWLDIGKQFLILDVRALKERQKWRIIGSIHVELNRTFLPVDNDSFIRSAIPSDTRIVIVCQNGLLSQKTAGELKSKGLDAIWLEGGMNAWGSAWNTAVIPTQSAGVEIIQVRRVGKGCLSYIIASEGEAIIIDPALDERVYIGLAYMNNWKIRYVVDTHLHGDHFSRAYLLAKKTHAQILLPEGMDYHFAHERIIDKMKLNVGSISLQALATPGHTMDSMAFFINNEFVFTGDTLFIDETGNPEAASSIPDLMRQAALLYQSIEHLMILPDLIKVLPGHVFKPVSFDRKPIFTTIGKLRDNLFWENESEVDFIDRIVDQNIVASDNFTQVREFNRAGEIPFSGSNFSLMFNL